MRPLVIVGTGLAGYTLAKAFRQLDAERPLLMVTADGGESYSKPMLSNSFSRGKRADDLAMATVEQMADSLNAEILTRTEVVGIEAAERRLILAEGTIDYEQLVLAVGASPISMHFAGDASEEVRQVNNLDDYQRLYQRLDQVNSMAVIGPGLIGCEFANDLTLAGKQVIVIGPDQAPLGRLLPPAVGDYLQQQLAEVGIEWQLDTVVESLHRDGDGYRLQLANGQLLQADLVLSAIGLRPKLELAEQAGLKVARGIVVDRRLRSSDPAIFALGDCAEVDGLLLPFVMPLMNTARALAKTLAGEPTEVRYPAMPVVVKTTSCPVVVSPPRPGVECQVEESVMADGVRSLYLDAEGQLQGFALVGSAVSDKQLLAKQLPAWLG